MDERVYWIWLSNAVTAGSSTFAKLLCKFSTAEEVYYASDEMIASAITSRSKDYTALCDKDLTKAEEIHRYCLEKNIGIVVFSDRLFPHMLKEIPTPPVLLYYRGTFPEFDSEFGVAVVGTRRLSRYGRKNAFTISYDLARSGALVISGMALGIDGVAHAGALSAGKKTVAVIGSGINVLYPKVHGHLAREIVKCGCVISEFAPFTPPEKQNFPIRNRLIGGLSVLTLVIEGRERSGALLTARHARAQDRAVYALPGNVGNATSEVTNLLIRNGAVLCTAADDIVRDYEIRSRGKLNPHELAKPSRVNMEEALSELKISCVSAEDREIFRPTKTERKKKEEDAEEPTATVLPMPEADLGSFDEKTVRLYQRIPLGDGCLVDSLVDGEMTLRDVMKGLLKLEMGCFVKMLPGERVRRNF